MDPAATLFTNRTAADPNPAYRDLRQRCPVARTDGAAPTVYLSRYDDVLWALRHPEVFSSDPGALSIGQDHPLLPLQVDPPLHTDYRRLMNPGWVPKAVAALEPDARVLVRELIDEFATRGSCDIHEELATPLPSTIFLRLMRLPQEDLAMFLQWRDNVIRPDVAPGDLEAAARLREETGHAITEYFEKAIDQRRREPDDGMLSELVHATFQGRSLTQGGAARHVPPAPARRPRHGHRDDRLLRAVARDPSGASAIGSWPIPRCSRTRSRSCCDSRAR